VNDFVRSSVGIQRGSAALQTRRCWSYCMSPCKGGHRFAKRALRATAFACVAATLYLFAPAVAEAERSVRSLAEIRHEGVVMQKWDLSCGSAALATLLTYDLGDSVDERVVATAMLRRTDPLQVRVQGGFSLLDLQQYAKGRGYKATGYGQMTMQDLVGLLPAIVPLELNWGDHFVVVREVRNDKVIFADSAFGNRTLPVEKFQRVWVQKIAFVVQRKPFVVQRKR
jgi:predicted double-glycine peptidase